MPVAAIGLDLAKSVFQVHGVDDTGHTVLRVVSDAVSWLRSSPN